MSAEIVDAPVSVDSVVNHGAVGIVGVFQDPLQLRVPATPFGDWFGVKLISHHSSPVVRSLRPPKLLRSGWHIQRYNRCTKHPSVHRPAQCQRCSPGLRVCPLMIAGVGLVWGVLFSVADSMGRSPPRSDFPADLMGRSLQMPCCPYPLFVTVHGFDFHAA